MQPLHKTLERQIKKYFGEDREFTPQEIQFFKAVSDTYKHTDEDRALIERSLELSSKELMDNNLEIERQVQVRTDELRKEHDRFVASVNSLRAGFIVCDINNKLIMVNPIAKKIFSARQTDQPSAPTPLEQLSLQQIGDKLGNSFDLQRSIQKAINDQEPIENKEVPFFDSILRFFIAPILSHPDTESVECLGTVILVEDVTEAKVLERSRDEFFSIASHELRTPLTAIRGNASMIQTYFSQSIQNDQGLGDIINDIHESSVRLIAIVNDFLETSRIEQGKISFAPEAFDVQTVIEKVAYEASVVGKEKGLQIKIGQHTLEKLPAVVADKSRTKQILYNLIGNAIKFTDTGTVSVDAQISEDYVKVTVSDTGRGIPPENQKLLFRKFQQAGSSILTRDSSRGTGLGLYISKLLAEGMRCSVGLDHSEQDRGTTFYLLLPIVTPEQLATLEQNKPADSIDPTTGLTQLESTTA